MFASLIAKEWKRFSYLLGGGSTEASDQEILEGLIYRKGDITDLKASLVTIMRMLKAYYGKPVILLLDEYDVPLDKANENGYYSEMVSFPRGFMGEAFKTNPDLYFAVVTGCLRVMFDMGRMLQHSSRPCLQGLFTGGDNHKTLSEDLTYGELEDSPENLWSVLYLTGYLTSIVGRRDVPFAKVPLVIPNKEIREIFVEKVQKWFEERVKPVK